MATQWIDRDGLMPARESPPLVAVPSSDRRLRIVICAWRDLAHQWAGGSEVLIDRIASGMTRQGHDVTLLAGGRTQEREYRVVRNGSQYSQYLRAPLKYLADFRDADLVVDVCNGMRRRLYFGELGVRAGSAWIDEHGDSRRVWQQLVEQS